MKINKKYIIASIVGLIAIISAVAIFIINKPDNQEVEDVIIEEKIADYILTFSKTGEVNLIDTKDENNNISNSISNNGDYLFYKSTQEKTVYALNKLDNKVYKVKEENGQITKEEVTTIKDITDDSNILWFSANRDYIVLEYENSKKEKSGKVIDVTLNKSKEIKEITDVTNSYLEDESFIYASGNKLHKLSLKDYKIIQIDIGDKTNKIIPINNELFVQNSFGSGLNNSIILNVNPKDLSIKNLYKFDTKTINLIENITYKSKVIPYYQTIEFENKNTISILSLNSELKKDKISYKDESLKADINAYYLNGYLYSYDNESNVIKAIKLTNKEEGIREFNIKCDFYFPIINE